DRHADEAHVARGEGLFEEGTTAGIDQADEGRWCTKCCTGDGDVQTLAAGFATEIAKPRHATDVDFFDVRERVDRRIEAADDDHQRASRLCASSSAAGWAVVPPGARVDSAPQATPDRRHSSSGR